MSAPVLSSELSYAQLLGILQNYSDYDLVDSAERARVFIQAGRMLLATPIVRSSMAIRSEEVELDPEILERQIQTATGWLAQKSRSSGCVRQIVIDPDWRD